MNKRKNLRTYISNNICVIYLKKINLCILNGYILNIFCGLSAIHQGILCVLLHARGTIYVTYNSSVIAFPSGQRDITTQLIR